MKSIDVSTFARVDRGWDELLAYLVVKSLDQIERRQRMIESKKRGTIGRIEARPVAEGLLCLAELRPGRFIDANSAHFCHTFREPRGLVRLDDHRLLLAEIAAVLEINETGEILNRFQHGYFGFLHSVDYHPGRNTFLVVSSGYDCLFEISREHHEVEWGWFAWDHGFCAPDGTRFVRSPKQAERLQQEGIKARYIDPKKYGEQGILTSQRTNHPNSACYNPYAENSIIVTLGRSGEVLDIDRNTGEFRVVLAELSPMPHGIQPFDGGWLVTNTLRGEFWLLDRNFQGRVKITLDCLPGKVAAAGEHEWLQEVIPVSSSEFVGIDANRGLIRIDIRQKKYTVVETDPNWCIHHALVANK